MNHDTKADILENKFVSRLRMELAVDEMEYERLCNALRCLAEEWKLLSVIDKELMQELYVLAAITKNMAPEIREKTSQVAEMAIKIDALVLDCLS